MTPDNGGSYRGQSFSPSQLLYAIKRKLQGAMLGGRVAPTLSQTEVDALERDALEVLSLVRSVKNASAPINWIPPEVLSIIPDYLDDEDGELVTLTHVCRGWREIFISRSSLWAHLDCLDVHQTHTYIKRSGSFPLDICLKKSDDEPYSDDALLLVTPHIGRLGSLTASGSADVMSDLVRHFSHPTPLLRKLKIELKFNLGHTSAIPTTIFNGDFSSLHELSLAGVAELPRRNLSNLKVFEFYCGARVNAPSITHLLDFFESAPLLSNIKLRLSIPISNAPSGRVVSVPHLKKLTIHSRSAHSGLLKHLSTPTGASLVLSFPFNRRTSPAPDDFPKNLDNLFNLSHTTSISLFLDPKGNRARFEGPSGQLHLDDAGTPYSVRCRIFRSLERLNLSNTRRLTVTKYIHSTAKQVGESPISKPYSS